MKTNFLSRCDARTHTLMLKMACSVLAICLLASCAGYRAFREGNQLLDEGKPEEGLAMLEESVVLEPKNAEYRIALATRRAAVVNRILSKAAIALQEDRLEDAAVLYRQVLQIDASSAVGAQGLQNVTAQQKQRMRVAEAKTLIEKGGSAGLQEALDRVRAVLLENPRHRDALRLKDEIEGLQAKAPSQSSALAAAFQRPISISFQDASLKSVFNIIAQVSGLNFSFDNDVRPDLRVTVNAKNSTIEDVVNLLLQTNRLKQTILNENSVLIYPNSPQKVKDYQALVVRSFFLVNADVKAVSGTIKALVKTQDMVVDERLGLIIMRDTPDSIRLAEKIVAMQDLSDPEVMLEVEILEIKRSRLLELGIQWPSQLTLAPLQNGTAPVTLQDLANINSSTTQATIGNLTVNARKEDSDANILANPRIRVRNKDKAKILIGDRVPVITATSTATGLVSETVTYLDVGLKLEVEPSIYLDEEVAIKINLEVSSLVKEVQSKSGSLSYQIGTRGANTVLRLKNGETQILAGLISDEDRASAKKVPGLGELPILGRLFGSQKDETQRSEILLSITPRVVRSLRRPDRASAEFDAGTDSNIGAKPLALRSAAPAIALPRDPLVGPATNVAPEPAKP